MKVKRDPYIRVHMCWETESEKKCVTLPKEQAYATRKWVEENKGVVWWFDAVN